MKLTNVIFLLTAGLLSAVNGSSDYDNDSDLLDPQFESWASTDCSGNVLSIKTEDEVSSNVNCFTLGRRARSFNANTE
jgi:hypothetical protein